MTSRKKPGVAFWATVALVAVLMGYPLSFGPWCWIASRTATHRRDAPSFYRPISMFADLTTAGTTMIAWYGGLLVAEGWDLYYDGNTWGVFDVEASGNPLGIELRLPSP